MTPTIHLRTLYIAAILAVPKLVSAEPIEPISFVNPLEGINNIPELIAALLSAFVTIMIPIIVLAIIYAGFLFVTAHGDTNQLEQAKKVLLYTIVGAVVVLGAEALANLIAGTLTTL